ncbi:MAG: spermidine synthase, partial [Pirellulaceae bacterium]
CPQLFSFQVEMNITLIAGFMIAMGVLWDDLWQSFLLNNFWKKSAAFILGFAFLLIVVHAQFHAFDSDAIIMKRNFYGVLKVKEEDYGGDDRIRELLNGRILHGSQFLDPLRSRMPTTYYDPQSGVGLALTLMRQSGPLRVAVVGLGTGTLAAYGGQGDYYCFYEINPNVREIATSQFTYLSDSPAEIHIELGDARISMDRQEPQQYDLIALDAFSGDAIPVHLLTKEAFELYYRHLKPKGVIAVHISNRHLDLSPVVKGLADHFQSPLRTVNNDRDEGIADAASEWVLVTRNTDLLSMPALAEASDEVQPDKQVPLWTDQYSNLFQIMD